MIIYDDHIRSSYMITFSGPGCSRRGGGTINSGQTVAPTPSIWRAARNSSTRPAGPQSAQAVWEISYMHREIRVSISCFYISINPSLARFHIFWISSSSKTSRSAKHTIRCASKSEYGLPKFQNKLWSESRVMPKTV